ncbi:hypothetical protein Tco_0795582 [Tanacetum coccineum]
MTPRSCLKWKPTGRVFKNVVLRWVPTGKTFASSTTKVLSYVRYIVQSLKEGLRCLVAEKTDTSENRASRNFDLMIIRWRLLKITLQAPTRIQGHIKEQTRSSGSKKVVSSSQDSIHHDKSWITIPPSYSNTEGQQNVNLTLVTGSQAVYQESYDILVNICQKLRVIHFSRHNEDGIPACRQIKQALEGTSGIGIPKYGSLSICAKLHLHDILLQHRYGMRRLSLECCLRSFLVMCHLWSTCVEEGKPVKYSRKLELRLMELEACNTFRGSAVPKLLCLEAITVSSSKST